MRPERPVPSSRKSRSGFTLPEALIAGTLLVIVIGSALMLYLAYGRVWRSAAVRMEADRQATLAMNRMVYGIGTARGLRTARAESVTLEPLAGGWRLSFADYLNQTNRIEFDSAQRRLLLQPGNRLIGANITQASANISLTGAVLSVRATIREGLFNADSTAGSAVRWRN